MSTATRSRKPAVKKQVQIIARYYIKRNGHVCYSVKSSNGTDTYCTTLINGKATGCTCPANKPCYHMTQLEAIEAQRKVATNIGSFFQVIALEAACAVDLEETCNAVLATCNADKMPVVEMVAAPAIVEAEAPARVDTAVVKPVVLVAKPATKQPMTLAAMQEAALKAPLNGNHGFRLLR